MVTEARGPGHWTPLAVPYSLTDIPHLGGLGQGPFLSSPWLSGVAVLRTPVLAALGLLRGFSCM